MKVNGKHFYTVWMEGSSVFLVEQNKLPFRFEIYEAKSYKDSCMVIRDMITRGAGAIGSTAAFAMAQAFLEAPATHTEAFLINARKEIEATRPTARNLFYATHRVFEAGKKGTRHAVEEAQSIARENVMEGERIAEFGNQLIKPGFRIMTHCNAGWLGFVDHGSALAPIYRAHQEDKDIFVWVDETRPRSQGARLTAWELSNEEVPFKIVPDNAGAYLMSRGMVDMIIVGADRVVANGDVANKIGTFEKAIVAKQFNIPFYVAVPSSTFDLNLSSGKEIVIEERDMDEVNYQSGPDEDGNIRKIRVSAPGSEAFNPAFDVTPAEFVTALITDRGIIAPQEEEIRKIMDKTIL